MHEMQQVLRAFLIFATSLGLLWPTDIGLTEWFGISPEYVPGNWWVASNPGALQIWRDVFLVTWLTVPLWLVLFGGVYSRNYESRGVSLPIAIMAIPVLLGLVGWVLWWPQSFVGHWEWVILTAAQHRVAGAFVFGTLHGGLFAFLALAIGKFPVDLARGGRG